MNSCGIVDCIRKWNDRNLSPEDYRLEPRMHKVNIVCIIEVAALGVCMICTGLEMLSKEKEAENKMPLYFHAMQLVYRI